MEIRFAAGLLKWVAAQTNEPYFTRSLVTARVAACLMSLVIRLEISRAGEAPESSHPTQGGSH